SRKTLDLVSGYIGEMFMDAQKLQQWGGAGDFPQWESTCLAHVRPCLDSVSSRTKSINQNERLK
ncbi:hypothetical protein ACQP3J_29810, partial [Escherichia coli]